MLPDIHCSIVHRSQNLEWDCVSIDGWKDKEDVVHVYSGVLLSQEVNELMPPAAMQMDLEITILSEVSQTHKGKYHKILLQWKEKRRNEFSLSLSWEQRIQREQWADLNIPSFLSFFFFLTLMLLTHLSVTKFAFLLPNSAGATLHTYFPWPLC